jgi:hypothetical protein
LVVQPNYSGLKVVWGEFGARSVFVLIRNAMRFLSVLSLEALFTTGLMAQTTAARAPAGIHLNSAPQYRVSPANPVVNGLPGGRTQVSRPMNSTPANDAVLRNNAWAAYNAELHQIPTTTNPNRLAARQNLLDQDRFIQRPTSSHRYNFQFSDNEIRSVQAALRRIGTYSGQVDGILGPDTRRAIEEYQGRNKLPVTGQPDRSLNASLGIF